MKYQSNKSILTIFLILLKTFKIVIKEYRGNVYRQVVGIPMGCNCAPQVADLFFYLYCYEYNYITKGVDSKNHIIHFLKYASRYIDDLNIPNINDSMCQIICNDIYPDELDIISTNICNLNTTFLDLDIIIEDGRFVSKLYDKRRDFVFKVITFPNLRSNIPNKTSYGTFIGEIFRICKSSTKYIDFVNDVKLLVNKLINQKFNKNLLYSCLNKFLNSKPACLSILALF